MSGPLGSSQWMYQAGEDYTIDQSLKFESSRDTYLSKTPTSAGNQKTWTWSGWVTKTKNSRDIIMSTTNGGTSFLSFGWSSGGDYEDKFYLYWYDGSNDYGYFSSRLFRDYSSFYHIVLAVDTTQATESNRVKLYVNGVEEPFAANNVYGSFPQNHDTYYNDNNVHYIGYNHDSSSAKFNGYLAEVHSIDGTALTPTSFGETGDYGEWKPILVTDTSGASYTSDLTYGTNGFYLPFDSTSALGADRSPNDSNHWTVNNITAADQMVDSPTNNFATLQPTDSGTGPGAISEGNLKVQVTTAGNYYSSAVSLGMNGGKWYFEYVPTRGGNNSDSYPTTNLLPDGSYCDSNSNPTGSIGTNLGTQDGDGGIYMVALDFENGYISRGRNGSWSNSATLSDIVAGNGTGAVTTLSAANIASTLRLVTIHRYDTGTSIVTYNFGQDSSFAGAETAQGNQDSNSIGDFYYTPPTDFLALCTSNLPDPAVIPSEHFNTVTYAGDSTDRTLTGVGFQPDFSWIKSRSNGTNGSDHWLFDSVRGVNAFKGLCSNGTSVEGESAAGSVQENFGDISAFTSDGYSVYRSTADASHQYEGVNNTGETYVAWNWKANGSGSSNTNGSTNTTATSANVDSGFSISTYTGTGSNATIGHGLSSAPEMVITKRRDSTGDWDVWHTGLGDGTKYIILDTNQAVLTASNIWNSTVPSSTLVSLGTHVSNNASSGTYIAYCFHSVDGYSKVGSYTGNANADGTFIYTGFRPAYVMAKRTDSTGNWRLIDSKRNSYNGQYSTLVASTSSADYTANDDFGNSDILSNGFKLRMNYAEVNASGGTYIYLAFAESPMKHTNAR